MQTPGAVDPWQYTLHALSGGCVLRELPREDASISASMRRGAAGQPLCSRHGHLAIVEMWSENLVSVSWSDPTSGRYSEQPFRLCIARRAGVCALTGERIQRGDKVYRPLSPKLRALSTGCCVLASALSLPASPRKGGVMQPQQPQQQEFDFYINLTKPTLGLYVRKGMGLPDLANTKDWQFSGHIWQSELDAATLKNLEANGHAFQELGS
jgi:hypothetical protein